MSRAKHYGLRGGATTAAIVLLMVLVSSCGLAPPRVVSPVFGASAPSFPGTPNQYANVLVCSVLGGPVTLVIDLADADVDTELSVGPGGPSNALRWNDGEDPESHHFRGPQTHYEATTTNALNPASARPLRSRAPSSGAPIRTTPSRSPTASGGEVVADEPTPGWHPPWMGLPAGDPAAGADAGCR